MHPGSAMGGEPVPAEVDAISLAVLEELVAYMSFGANAPVQTPKRNPFGERPSLCVVQRVRGGCRFLVRGAEGEGRVSRCAGGSVPGLRGRLPHVTTLVCPARLPPWLVGGAMVQCP